MRCIVLSLLLALPVHASADESGWIELFNGTDLTGWTPKIRGYEAGSDPDKTFIVQDGLLTVSYANYDDFDNQFGHLFYQTPYSRYRLQLEYRFVGEQAPNGQAWAFKNSGVMVHSQAPGTMPAAQDFPISVEVQFLGGRGDGQPRPTGNLCTPGTHVDYQGAFTETHCLVADAPTFHGEEWVQVEVLVEGGERIVHLINGQPVIEYTNVVTGGGVVSGHDPEMKPEGRSLNEGYIALQSESHPIQFRSIRLQSLSVSGE